MSTMHLAADSERPPDVEDQARLYSMRFCPFVHRINLILGLKQIPHDIVYINLKNKPEWYFQIHPEGKVPAYKDADGTIVAGSETIANYLDQKYPEPPLYRDETKSRDLELIDHYSKIVEIFGKCVYGKDKRELKEIVAEIMDDLQEFEHELSIRQTPFFGGSNPGMLDIMMWPWVELAKSLSLIYKQTTGFDKDRFPKLMGWIGEMKEQSFVQENKRSYEKFVKFVEFINAENIDYDNI